MNNFTNFNLSYYDMFSYIAILLTCISTYFLMGKKINVVTFLIYSGVSLLICFTSIYQSAVLADELNLSGTSNQINLIILNVVIIVASLFIKDRKKN
ncbi:hypothetical protein LZ906_017140 (plasmid) [Paraclostridium ghonii]|uniref:hypothetical protein n=1 Tax=Paraclostridium ghonii TaxID=29358 RepID=UPI00202CDA2E|nr:hypothetical protein [Paeniclostridium ghonii]MCM0165409.1 hypothetical protein [Paeniclostridium ghonii]